MNVPVELSVPPLTYIALFGLNVAENKSHAAIWDFLSQNRKNDRAPLNFKYFTLDHTFIAPKSKRTSYEWYIPKGILKTNWFHKHLCQIPSLVVLFVELDWDSPLWNEKRNTINEQLEIIRQRLENRSTKVALVLIQKALPHPGNEDLVAKERAATLCSSCDLSAKALFVLPIMDQMEGFILKIEHVFYELCYNVYQHEIKYLKNHKDALNKTTHQYLFVRHQFKIAFYCEMKQDNSSALKNYKQAYTYLMEVRASDMNMMEVKTIAGFINYKICQLYFIISNPLDAINQFRNHIDIFKNKPGPKELLFEHSAWLSDQFNLFGMLFEEAVLRGLSAIQVQHPGFYFHQAAIHATTRKEQCHKLCSKAVYPAVDPLCETLEFYGQRPWRPGNQSAELTDPEKELEGIQALQYKEFNTVKHSNIIISLLEKTIIHFHKHRSTRMKHFLKIRMGEEYFSSGQNQLAADHFYDVLNDMKLERWPLITTTILNNALKAAYLCQNLEQYLGLSLEYISSWIQSSPTDKIIVQTGIEQILQTQAPGIIPGIPLNEGGQAHSKWEVMLMTLPLPHILHYQMDSASPFIVCQAGFLSHNLMADAKVAARLYIRVNCPRPIKFHKISLVLNNRIYDSLCITTPGLFDPTAIQKFEFSFIIVPEDVGKILQVQGVSIQLGASTKLICNLLCPTPAQLPWPGCQRLHPKSQVQPRNSRFHLTLSHNPPLLRGEIYCLHLNFQNREETPVQQLNFTLKDRSQNAKAEFLDSEFTPKNCYTLDLSPDQKEIQHQVYIKPSQVGDYKIEIEYGYSVEVTLDPKAIVCSCSNTQLLDLPCVEPFLITSRFLNQKVEILDELKVGLSYLINVQLKSKVDIPIVLEDALIELNHPFVLESGETNLPGVELEEGSEAADCYMGKVTDVLEKSSKSPGKFTLTWKRQDNSGPNIETVYHLESINVKEVPLFVELQAPSHGWVRTPLSLGYVLFNQSSQIHDVEVYVDSSDAFMYSGNKQYNFRILPKDSYNITYNLYPLIAGFVSLPNIRVILNMGLSTPLPIDNLPTHLFILPQSKQPVIAV